MLFMVHIDGQNRTKDLLTHGLVHGVLRKDDCWLDEVTLGLVVLSASDDFYARRSLGLLDVSCNLVKGFFINYRIDKVAEVLSSSHAHRC